jgi:hypothetical protein
MDPTFRLFGKAMCAVVVMLGGLRLFMDAVEEAKHPEEAEVEVEI